MHACSPQSCLEVWRQRKVCEPRLVTEDHVAAVMLGSCLGGGMMLALYAAQSAYYYRYPHRDTAPQSFQKTPAVTSLESVDPSPDRDLPAEPPDISRAEHCPTSHMLERLRPRLECVSSTPGASALNHNADQQGNHQHMSSKTCAMIPSLDEMPRHLQCISGR